ncbi:MAG: ferritin-like domain-containing protein [Flavobacteriales bacterium]
MAKQAGKKAAARKRANGSNKSGSSTDQSKGTGTTTNPMTKKKAAEQAKGRTSGKGTTRRSSAQGGSSGTVGKRSQQASNARKNEGGPGAQSGLMKLFHHQLADLYYVERQLLKVLPKMADKAHHDELADFFLEHSHATEQHVERLEEIFDLLERTARGKRCEAMDGILDEAKELMEEFKDDPAMDAALVCAAQKVEHYEITTYGSLAAFAHEMGMDTVVEILEETLDEEKDADEWLSELAEGAINRSGHMEDGQEDGEDGDDGEEDVRDQHGNHDQRGGHPMRRATSLVE